MKGPAALLILGAVTWTDLWLRPDQHGQRLLNRGEFSAAAEAFEDPMRRGAAWYRGGAFQKAEQAFARLATPEAHYNRGNCLVLRGNYTAAVVCYDNALDLRPDWEAALTNRAIASARAEQVESKGGDLGDQRIGADKVVFDRDTQSDGQNTQVESDQALSDAAMQSLWLRRVRTKPADFLRAKFAYQAAAAEESGQ